MTTSAKPSLPLTLHPPADPTAARTLFDESTRSKFQRTMRLADFILTNRRAILAEWEEFARTCSPASASMGLVALSDHASEMLTVIAEDLKTPQGALQQSEKSKGHAPLPAEGAG